MAVEQMARVIGQLQQLLNARAAVPRLCARRRLSFIYAVDARNQLTVRGAQLARNLPDCA